MCDKMAMLFGNWLNFFNVIISTYFGYSANHKTSFFFMAESNSIVHIDHILTPCLKAYVELFIVGIEKNRTPVIPEKCQMFQHAYFFWSHTLFCLLLPQTHYLVPTSTSPWTTPLLFLPHVGRRGSSHFM